MIRLQKGSCKRFAGNYTTQRHMQRKPIKQDLGVYSVKEIRGDRCNLKGQKQFRVNWEGYSSDDDTIEPMANVTGTCDLGIFNYFGSYADCYSQYAPCAPNNSAVAPAPKRKRIKKVASEQEDAGVRPTIAVEVVDLIEDEKVVSGWGQEFSIHVVNRLALFLLAKDLARFTVVCKRWHSSLSRVNIIRSLNFPSWFKGTELTREQLLGFCAWFTKHWGNDRVENLILGDGFLSGPLATLPWDEQMVRALVSLAAPTLFLIDIRGVRGICLPNSERNGCPGADAKHEKDAAILSFLDRIVRKIDSKGHQSGQRIMRMRFSGCRMMAAVNQELHRIYDSTWQRTINLQVIQTELCSVKDQNPNGKPHEFPAFTQDICAFCNRRLCHLHGPVLRASCGCVRSRAARVTNRIARDCPSICLPCLRERKMDVCGCMCASCLPIVLACPTCKFQDPKAFTRKCISCGATRCRECIRDQDWSECSRCHNFVCRKCEMCRCQKAR